MLCHSCRSTILEGAELWGYHHLSPDEADKCVFCSRIQEDLVHHLNSYEGETNQKLHWWSLRKPGRIREDSDFVNVVFTPITESSITSLPVRSFHLFEEGE